MFEPRVWIDSMVSDGVRPCIELQTINNNLFRCITPTKKNIISLGILEDKLLQYGDIEYLSKKDLINKFDIGDYSFMYWSHIHTKTLGTFLVVKSIDKKYHLISMLQLLNGCNFHYDYSKKSIYSKSCNTIDSNKSNDYTYYEFSDHVIILTPHDLFELSCVLSNL